MKSSQLNEFGTACESLVWCHSCGIQYHSCGIGPTPVESVPLLWTPSPLLWTPQESCESYRNGGGTEKYCLVYTSGW